MIALAILNAYFWRMGGAGAGPWRKIGWPALVLCFGLYHGFLWWQSFLAAALAVFAVTRPFTYHGSSIHEHWFNWLWIWILGVLLWLPMICFGHFIPWPLAWSLAATLSNIKRTTEIFTWPFCECLAGITVML